MSPISKYWTVFIENSIIESAKSTKKYISERSEMSKPMACGIEHSTKYAISQSEIFKPY